MPQIKALTSIALAVTFLTTPLVAHAAQEDDELFVLTGSKASSHVTYDDYRKVRVCVDETSVSKPLRIQHGLGTNMVEPGSCYTFQSTEFRVSTRGLKSDEQLIGRAETVSE